MSAEKTVLPLSAPQPRVVVRLSRALTESWRAWNGRRAMRRLNDLSDWELMDIGLTREDLRRAYDFSIFDDPTQHLQQIVQGRARGEGVVRRRS